MIGRALPDQPPKMFFAQCDDMVHKFAAAAPNPTLSDSILPGRMHTGPLRFQTRRLQKRDNARIEDRDLRRNLQDAPVLLGFRGFDARDRRVQASSEVSRHQCSSVCRRTLAYNTAACHHRPALVRADERRGSTLVQFAHRARPTRSARDTPRRIVTEVSPLKALYRVADSGSPRKVQWTRDSVYRFRGSSPTPGLTVAAK